MVNYLTIQINPKEIFMNYLPFLIAKRLHRQKKNYMMWLISMISKLGIAVSIFSLIISFSILNGFKTVLNNTILSTIPHGIIQLTNHSSLKWQDIIKKLKFFPDIVYTEPYIVINGLLTINNKVKLIEIKSVSNIKYLQKKFSIHHKKNIFFRKQFSKKEIIISSRLAKNLFIQKGDWINLIVFNKKNNNINFNNINSFSLKVIDFFESNGILDEYIGYAPFEFFTNCLHLEKNINSIELHMSDPFDADKIIIEAAKIINAPTFLYTWINSYKNIYHDITKIKAIIYLILFLLVVISCFSIASISFMIVSKKTKEIAILKGIGANNFLIQLIFLFYGLRSIIIGSIIGLITGIITILNFKHIIWFLNQCFKNTVLSDNIYYNGFIILQLNISDVIIIFVNTVIIGIITNWYPAYYASKINSSEILKKY